MISPIIAVLRASGNLKRSEGHLPEDILVLRAIIDVNAPKFLAPDVPLFNGITSDLFPGVKLPEPDRQAMQSKSNESCVERNLQLTDYFWGKIVQIYDMMVVRCVSRRPTMFSVCCWDSDLTHDAGGRV